MFGGSVDDCSHAVGEQLYFLPAQRQGGARRQRQDELRGARGRPPGAAQRLHPGIYIYSSRYVQNTLSYQSGTRLNC